MAGMTRLGIVAAAVVWVASRLAPVQSLPTSLMFQVEPREEECMYQSIEAGSQVRADLTIVRGGKLDARLKIDAPSAGRLFEKLLLSNIDDVTGNIVDTLIKKGHSVSAQAATGIPCRSSESLVPVPPPPATLGRCFCTQFFYCAVYSSIYWKLCILHRQHDEQMDGQGSRL